MSNFKDQLNKFIDYTILVENLTIRFKCDLWNEFDGMKYRELFHLYCKENNLNELSIEAMKRFDLIYQKNKEAKELPLLMALSKESIE